ncbi:hypothetical protein [Marinomonas sp. 2405UD68-3]|uniref:hypothetical protein n=1 Tax=Marinomonas sp. 2405UD68-3 TaxID=3391835 RepID=UPI0039C9AD9C
MHNVLLVWDARRATKSLKNFIRAFEKKSSHFNMTLTVIQFNYKQDLSSGRIRYGMRALFNQIHDVNPDIILSFGAQANILAKLLKPALGVPLICNALPEGLEHTGYASSTLDTFTQKFSEHFKWKAIENPLVFIPTMASKVQFNGSIGVISEDPNGPVLANIIKQQQANVVTIEKQNVLERFFSEFEGIDLLVLSIRACNDGHLIHCANACGIPIILVCHTSESNLIKEGYNGWVASSLEDPRLIRYIRNWNEMSEEAKRVLSQYSQDIQSQSNGIHHFFTILGLKERPTSLFTNKKTERA